MTILWNGSMTNVHIVFLWEGVLQPEDITGEYCKKYTISDTLQLLQFLINNKGGK